jgi:uncharacterized protein (TIGR03083 family)
MTTTPIAEQELMGAVAAERQDLAILLRDLPEDAWDAATLCAGWRVRELIAHVTMPFRYGTARFIGEMLRSGGRFNAMADRCARRDAAQIPAVGLVAALSDNASNPWSPPGGGLTGALTHDVVHGLDWTVPLGIDRRVPEERLRIVLDAVTREGALKHFGTDLAGIELHAEDLGWSFGSGEQLTGAAQDLLLVICGRKLPSGRLNGASAQRFCAV